MKIGILSRNQHLYSTRRLVEATRARGHHARVIDTLSIAVEMGGDASANSKDIKTVLAARQPGGLQNQPVVRLPLIDAIIPRIGASVTDYGVAVVRQMEVMEIVTTASARGIAISQDKLRSLQLMAGHELPIPKTAVISPTTPFLPVVQSLGGPPVVIKVNRGTQGRGVILAPNFRTVEAVLTRLRRLKRPVLVQKFVKEAAGKDLRILVVGKRCVAAMERSASAGDFRSNLHRGGTAKSVTLDGETARLALRAAHIHGLAVAGVDIIQSERGPLLLEVNSSPGLEGIEETTGVDVASAIVQHVERVFRRQQKHRPYGGRRQSAIP